MRKSKSEHDRPFIDIKPLNLSELPPIQRNRCMEYLAHGVSLPADLKPEYRNLVDAGALRPVLIDSGRFNAFAVNDRENYYIALHGAVIPIVALLFSAILREPYVLPGFGKVETPYRPSNMALAIPRTLPINEKTGEMVSLKDALAWQMCETRPKGVKKRRIAEAMTDIAISFMMFHEAAHVFEGHTTFCERNFADLRIFEFDAFQNLTAAEKSDRCGLYRAWEWDADSLASGMLLRFTLGEPFREQWARRLFLNLDPEEYPYESLSSTLLSLFILFLYMGQDSASAIHQPSNILPHPHPIVRVTAIANQFRETGINELGLHSEKLGEHLERAWEAAFAILRETGMDSSYLEFDPDDDQFDKDLGNELDLGEDLHLQYYDTYKMYSWRETSPWNMTDPARID